LVAESGALKTSETLVSDAVAPAPSSAKRARPSAAPRAPAKPARSEMELFFDAFSSDQFEFLCDRKACYLDCTKQISPAVISMIDLKSQNFTMQQIQILAKNGFISR
jgi:hypothetical protein